MLFISEILMIRSSVQVKSLSATLVVRGAYEPTRRRKWRLFLLIQIPFPSGIISQTPTVHHGVGQLWPQARMNLFVPLPALPPFFVSCFGHKLCSTGHWALKAPSWKGYLCAMENKLFLYMYCFLMYNCTWSFFTKTVNLLCSHTGTRERFSLVTPRLVLIN